MPFKLNAKHCHRVSKQTFKVTNSLGALLRSWHGYDASLRQRGSLTAWVTEEATAAWMAEPRTTWGGQRTYSPLAIFATLTLRAAFAAIPCHYPVSVDTPSSVSTMRRRHNGFAFA